MEKINVVGAGLAGCEAVHQLTKRGVPVRLYEMKPKRFSPAHKSEKFAELVCSNSLRAASITNAVGLLKQEMRELDSIIMRWADETTVPAGGALAVNRDVFSARITEEIEKNPLVEIIHEEIVDLGCLSGITIIATGPLTSEALGERIMKLTGMEHFHFFDAAAPIVTGDSIDYTCAYAASRYGKGTADYLNCPMNQTEYNAFYEALVSAECVEIEDFEHNVFEGCMPVEEMARRGRETLCFGPMKPVGLRDPATGREAYAVVQLRKEDEAGTLYNIVGFQTHLRFPEQKRVFGMIPALKNAEYVRYGVMHRNSYINSPKLLDANYKMKDRELFFAGQITGVEGYVESAASGLIAGISAARLIKGQEPLELSAQTAIGSLGIYISSCKSQDFQPMNVNFGIMTPMDVRYKKKADKNEAIAARALAQIQAVAEWV